MNCNVLIRYAAQKLMSSTMDMKETWDLKAGISLAKAASTFIPYFNLRSMIEVIENRGLSENTKQILQKLAKLYGVT